MPDGSRREYMRGYMRERRAREREGRTAPGVHEACDRRIRELEAEIRWLKDRETPVPPRPVEDILDDLL